MVHPLYQYDKAAIELEHLAKTRISTGYLQYPIANYSQSFDSSTFTCTSTGSINAGVWRATTTIEETGELEEIVFTVHGVLEQCELPPIIKPLAKPSSAKYLQQRIVLTGLDTPTFNDARDGLARVEYYLRLNVRDYNPQYHVGIRGSQGKLHLSNRYFTSKRFAEEMEDIAFPTEIDPKGILNSIRGDSLVHTTENDVEYYERYYRNGEQHFRKIQPAHITKGDIVEVQFTMTLFESLHNKEAQSGPVYNTKLILRSITLLDRHFSEARSHVVVLFVAPTNICIQQCRSSVIAGPKRNVLKRKVGYDEEQSQEARDRFKKMSIDNPNDPV
ncbi:hypothetical protein VNI00_016635 [Paramarasmius palmivorus]|uniref:Uncharacterized protein n=1 Tax=Paramarasmius palmivorus TaxID=297713 RepID=A0AAW0BE20_9AGAR